MDEQALDLMLEAESHAIAPAIEYIDTHSYEREQRESDRRAERAEWGWM